MWEQTRHVKEEKQPTECAHSRKKKKKKKKAEKGKRKKETRVLALIRLPPEVLVQIFFALEDHFTLWSLRSTCKCFNNVISSFPVLGTTTLEILIDIFEFHAIEISIDSHHLQSGERSKQSWRMMLLEIRDLSPG